MIQILCIGLFQGEILIVDAQPGLNNVAVEIDKTAGTEESLMAITVSETLWSKGHGNVYVLQVVSLMGRRCILETDGILIMGEFFW